MSWVFNPFTGRMDLAAAGGGGGSGNVSNVGTPTNGQLAQWTGATTVQGLTLGTGVATALGNNVGATGGLDTINGSATLTNKTIDSASNTLKISGTTVTGKSGNTGSLATTSGTLTNAHLAAFDASGNIVDGGAALSAGSGLGLSGTTLSLGDGSGVTYNGTTHNFQVNGTVGAYVGGSSPDPMYGFDGQLLTSGSGNIGVINCGHFLSNHGGSGTVTTALGVNTRAMNSGTGNISDAVGVQINTPLATSTGRITSTVVGLQIDDQTATPGSATVKWNIYSRGSGSNNVFDGTLQLNSLTPSSLVGLNAYNITVSYGIATVANYRAATASTVLTSDAVWSAADYVALTDASTVAVDLSTGVNFSVTLGGNRTLGNPSNTKNGQSGSIVITQDGTGSRTLAYSSNWKFSGAIAPVLTTTAGAKDILNYVVINSTTIYATLVKDVR